MSVGTRDVAHSLLPVVPTVRAGEGHRPLSVIDGEQCRLSRIEKGWEITAGTHLQMQGAERRRPSSLPFAEVEVSPPHMMDEPRTRVQPCGSAPRHLASGRSTEPASRRVLYSIASMIAPSPLATMRMVNRPGGFPSRRRRPFPSAPRNRLGRVSYSFPAGCVPRGRRIC
mgnify:CR=1 FL=1